MSIAFIDFSPLKWGKKKLKATLTMQELLDEVNAWASKGNHDLLNVETLLLPVDVRESSEPVLTSNAYPIHSDIVVMRSVLLQQVIRVWYQPIS